MLERMALGLDVQLLPVDPDAAPTLTQQVQRIVLDPITASELDELPIGRADATEDLRKDTVFVELRMPLEAKPLEPFRIGKTRLGQRRRDVLARLNLMHVIERAL